MGHPRPSRLGARTTPASSCGFQCPAQARLPQVPTWPPDQRDSLRLTETEKMLYLTTFAQQDFGYILRRSPPHSFTVWATWLLPAHVAAGLTASPPLVSKLEASQVSLSKTLMASASSIQLKLHSCKLLHFPPLSASLYGQLTCGFFFRKLANLPVPSTQAILRSSLPNDCSQVPCLETERGNSSDLFSPTGVLLVATLVPSSQTAPPTHQ